MAWSKEEGRRYWEENKDKYNSIRREKWKNDPEFRSAESKRRKTNYKYKPQKWRLRFLVLNRDKFTCQYCGRKAPDVVLHVDHILPKSKGGKNTLDNLRAACEECNIGKSNLLVC